MSVAATIESKVREDLEPTHLEVIDESDMHDVPAGAESHFRLLVVSERFEGMSRVERHRAVYRVLAAELDGPLHALGLQALTPAEWDGDGSRRLESPPCLGGDGTEPGTGGRRPAEPGAEPRASEPEA